VLKPEVSLPLALATGVVVWAVYQHAMPSVLDHRVGDKDDAQAATAERQATWMAAGIVAGMSLLAKDPTVFVVGGSFVVALSFWHRYSNMVNPLTGQATASGLANPMGGLDMMAAPDDTYID
jgi:4-amino-4-deoxy-L-arabinose transferase-like glycosyltransferase